MRKVLSNLLCLAHLPVSLTSQAWEVNVMFHAIQYFCLSSYKLHPEYRTPVHSFPHLPNGLLDIIHRSAGDGFMSDIKGASWLERMEH